MTFYANLLPILREDLSKSVLLLDKKEGLQRIRIRESNGMQCCVDGIPSEICLSWECGDVLSTILLLKVRGPPRSVSFGA